MAQAEVSIVILSALRLELTQRCLDAIFAHTPSPFEVVVVDMGLSSEVADWLRLAQRERPSMTVVANAENVGTSRGRNQGIAASRGAILAFLDNDAMVTPGWLEPLIETLEGSDRVGACGPKIVSEGGRVLIAPSSLVCSEENGRVAAIGLRLSDTYAASDPRVNEKAVVPWYPTTCLVAKRGAMASVGGFDEALFMVEEDKDLCLRLRRQGFDVLYVPASEVIHARQEAAPEYRRFRDDAAVIAKDIACFEAKWGAKVMLECHRSYLRKIGLSELGIRIKQRLDPFTTVLDD